MKQPIDSFHSYQHLKKPTINKLAHIVLLTACSLTLLVLAGCHSTKDSDIVAEAYGHLLYRSDLEGLVAPDLSKADSAIAADNYINQWIQQTVILEEAKKEINKNFDKELENYLASLLTYEYEQLVIDRDLDTIVSNKELSEYYNEHQDNFTLRTNIVKAIYVKFDKDAPPVKSVIKLMSASKIGDNEMDLIQKAAMQYGRDYSFDTDSWVPFYKFQTVVPVSTFNEELFLKNNHNIVVSDSSSTYIAKIFEYRLNEQLSPMSYETERIRNIILNGRRITIIKEMQRALLETAVKEGKIKKYK
ncbi:MAG: hypothetical protein II975_06010 [Bacteroidales bacterium]|nr:hypothetical protein [Bacteroidales bacterium]